MSLLIIENPVGWLVLVFAPVVFLFEKWWEGELHRLSPISGSSQIEDLLAGNILGQLNGEITSEKNRARSSEKFWRSVYRWSIWAWRDDDRKVWRRFRKILPKKSSKQRLKFIEN